MKLYSFSHSYGQSAYHFVFCPKYRRRIFADAAIRQLCCAIFYEIAERYGMRIYELRILPDHVHLFVELPPTICVAKAKQLFEALLVNYVAYIPRKSTNINLVSIFGLEVASIALSVM